MTHKPSAVPYGAGDNWAYYHGDPAGSHYSRLTTINTLNVHRLKVAWTYDTKEPLSANSTIESNPLVIDGRLFFVSSNGRLISLDGATGVERWVFDPGAKAAAGFPTWRRGVSYWTDGEEERIFFTFGDDLYAVDAATGRAAAGFGVKGRIPLGGRAASPGAVWRDLIILGGSTSTIRAFDVRTGALRWTFHTIPRPGEFGYDTWPPGAWKTATGVNNWSGLSLDDARGIVFVPLAFPGDFSGAKHIGDNLFGTSLVALDARTGRRLWHFQAIRHDVWDRDLPAPPTLITVVREGKPVDAVAQVTKHGFIFVLDRVTGRSLFPLAEKPTFASDLPGVLMPKTQIEPLLPAPFARQHLTADQLTRRTPEAAAAVAAQFATLRSRGLWDPPSERGTVISPGPEGVGWGGAAFDPESRLLYVNANEMPWIFKLKKQSLMGDTRGSVLYRENCASCHGENREGRLPQFPSLIGVGERLTFHELAKKIGSGGGQMPAFQSLAADQSRLWRLIGYLRTGIDPPEEKLPARSMADQANGEDAYVVDGMPRFVDPEGYPAIAPPWGTLSAIDLNTGQYVWTIPFGEYPELAAQGLKNTGSENYGGALVTAGGLLFIGATSFDKKFRAYDKRTGKLLWETVLPAAGNASPSTYRVKGRQFVVIPAGGGRPPTAESGSKIVAFSLSN